MKQEERIPRRTLVWTALTAGLSSRSGGTLAAQPQDSTSAGSPAALIKSLYRLHNTGRGPIFGKQGRQYLDRYFDRRLAGLIWKNVTGTPPGDAGNLDFDPLYDTQDPVITAFQIGEPRIELDKATVPVSFRNAGRKTKILFQLISTSAGWRIQDLIYGSGQTLVKILNEPL